MTQPTVRPLREIAIDIVNHWDNVYFGAVPYLDAMLSLVAMTDKFGQDSAKDIVAYFLVNAKYWRGPDAKRIKDELRGMK